MCKEETHWRQIGSDEHRPMPSGHTASMGYIDPKKVWIDSRGVVHTSDPLKELDNKPKRKIKCG